MSTFIVLLCGREMARAEQWAEIISQEAGGCSLYNGWGYWVNPEGELEREPHIRLEATGDTKGLRQAIKDLADRAIADGEQCVWATVDGEPWLIE